MNAKAIVPILLLLAMLGLGGVLIFSDGGVETPTPSEAKKDRSKKPRKSRTPRRKAKPSTQGLPKGVSFVEAEKLSEAERQDLISKSKSPHHFDEGMEYGFIDANGKWVAADGPGRLASDGYFYDAQGRRISARKSIASTKDLEGSHKREGEREEEEKDKKPRFIIVKVTGRDWPIAIGDALVEVAYADTSRLPEGKGVGAIVLSGTTNGHGVVRFPLAQESHASTFTVSAFKDGWKPDPKNVHFDLADAITINAHLIPDWNIRGIVQDSLGNPLPGATISGGVFEGLTSQSDGRFQAKEDLSAEVDLTISLEGYQTEFVHDLKPPGSDLIITMKRAAFIHGKVVDQDGEALQHVRVESRYEPELQSPFVYTVFTGADGSYSVECPEGAERLKMIYTRAGYRSVQEHPVRFNSELNITLEKTDEATVSGVLVYADGSSPTSATVSIGERTNENQYPEGQPHRFELSFKPKEGESYQLKIIGPDFAMKLVDIGALATGESKDLGEIVVEAGATICGSFSFPLGAGPPVIPDFEIEGIDTYRFSGVYPVFEIENLPSSGSFTFTAKADGYKSPRIEISLPYKGELAIVFEYEDISYQLVRVLHNESKLPLEGVPIAHITDHGKVEFKTDSKGEVLLKGRDLTTTLFMPRSTSESEIFFFVPRFFNGEGHESEEAARRVPLIVSALPNGMIAGKVEGVIEDPGARLFVNVSSLGGSNYDASVFAPNPSFPPLFEDKYDFETPQPLSLARHTVGCDQLHIKPRLIEITESKVYEFNINAIATITLRGQILKADGSPHANRGFYVFRSKGNGVVTTLTTDAQGRYEFPNAWPGDYHFAIAKDNSEQAAQFFEKVNVKSGNNEQTQNIRLPSATATIKGVIKYPDGTPVAGTTVSMTNRGVTLERGVLSGYVRTDSEGRFAATRIENNAEVIVRVGGYADGAETAVAFSELIFTGGQGSSHEIELIVARKGASGRVTIEAAENVYLHEAHTTGIITTSEGFKIGNFFNGHFLDLPPGSYSYQCYANGYVCDPVTITVSADLKVTQSGKAIMRYDPDWPAPIGE